MSDNLKDILSHLSSEIDQETLLLYLQNKLSAEKKHEVEKKLLENEFANEAAEGLQQFTNKEKLGVLVDQLNHELKTRLQKKRKNSFKGASVALPGCYCRCHTYRCQFFRHSAFASKALIFRFILFILPIIENLQRPGMRLMNKWDMAL
jgi:hypothetical protein